MAIAIPAILVSPPLCEQNVNESISTSSSVMLVAHSDTKAHTFSSNLMAMSYAVDIKPVEDDF